MGLVGLLIDVGTHVVSNIKEKKEAKKAQENQALLAKQQAQAVNVPPSAPPFVIPAQTQNKFKRAINNRDKDGSGGGGNKKEQLWMWIAGGFGALLLGWLFFFKKGR